LRQNPRAVGQTTTGTGIARNRALKLQDLRLGKFADGAVIGEF
jgi:hypothetical protein